MQGIIRPALKRLTVLTLVFLFVFSSPGLLLATEEIIEKADESSIDSSASLSAGDQIVTDEVSEDTNPETLPAEQESQENMGMLLEDEGDPEYGDERKPISSSLKVETDMSSGALVYTYPIITPPGRNGMEPDLKLTYNSQNEDNDSIVGYGWSLNIPYIERINRKGVDKLYSENYFYSSLSGELKKITDEGEGMQQMSVPGGEEADSVTASSISEKKTGDTALLIDSGQAYTESDGTVKLYNPVELESERVHNGNTYLSGYTKNGLEIKTSRFYSGEVNYYNKVTEKYEPIDTRLNDKINGWVMDKAAYQAKLDKFLSAKTITFINQGQELYFSLLGKTEKPVVADKIIFDAVWSNKKVQYPDALGTGIDLEVSLNNEALIKEAVIKNLESLGELSEKEYVEIPFLLTSNRKIDIKVDEKLLSEETIIISKSLAEIIDDAAVVSYIWPPRAQAFSDKIGSTTVIDIVYEQTESGIVMTKKIPVAWLKNAVFPVRADATVSYITGNGDGYANYQTSQSYAWTSAHDADNGTGADYTQSNIWARSAYLPGGNVDIIRAFYPFDTSPLPDQLTITDVSLNVYVAGKESHDNDGDDFISVVNTFQASNTSLTRYDYADCGDRITNPTEGVDTNGRKDISNIATGQYLSFDLNATGTAWIIPTGYTKLGLREGHDILNHELYPYTYLMNEIHTYSSEQSGTSTDPYLEVTYSEIPYYPDNLEVERQTNPLNVSDQSPEFSAIFIDNTPNDTAEYYQIQVSTSSSDWGNLLWDSGKSALQATTSSGSRCEEISYNGDSLARGATYYWRIKFWDIADNEGDWSSGEDYFEFGSDYGAKIDNGEFLEYEFVDNAFWLATDKHGNIYKFGQASSTRQDDANDDERAFKWMLEEITDANGNRVKYEYYKDRGQIYPYIIKYTGRDGDDGIFEVEFFRETRNDKATSTETGFSVYTGYRINEIQSKINSVWVNKYELDYIVGDNGARSMLNSVTRTGKDEFASAIALPLDSFQYQAKQKSWSIDNNFSGWPDFLNGYDDNGVRSADVNGDGLTDFVQGRETSPNSIRNVYINKGDGSGWAADANYSVPVDFVQYGGADNGALLADVNGDSLADIVIGKEISGGSDVRSVYINDGDGTGWTLDNNWSLPTNFVRYGGYDNGARISDVNGDGLADIVYARTGSRAVYINNGSGWNYDSNYIVPVDFVTNYEDMGTRMVDVNGDGLMDIIRSYQYCGPDSTSAVYINNGMGTGWDYNSNYSVPVTFNHCGVGTGARLSDVNGDGLTDIVQGLGYCGGGDSLRRVYTNKNDGSGWVFDSNYSVPLTFQECYEGTDGRIVDVDGDGLDDMINNSYVYISDGYKADLLNENEQGLGAKLKFVYQSSAEYNGIGGELLNPYLPINVQTVSKIITNDGFGNISTTTYEYAGGDYYYNGEYDRRFAGFEKITATNDLGHKTINYYHQGNTSSSTIGEYEDDQSKIGRIYRKEAYDASGNLYSKSISKWENYDLGNERDFVYLTQSLEQSYDGDVDHRDKATSYRYDDANGNLVQKTFWGEVSGSDNGTFTDTGNDLASTTISYAASTTLHLVGLPASETMYDQSGNKVQESKYYYDSLGAGEISKGNLTKQEMWKSGGDYIDVEKTYNSYGLVTQEKDPREKTTNYVYDVYNLYVATSTNAENHITQYYYDYSAGKPKKIIDPNSRVFETVFDALDRVKQEKQPDIDTPTTLVVKTEYAYDDVNFPRSINRTDYLNAATSTETYIYLDGFDRVVQERREAEEAGVFAAKDFAYNELGLLEKESLPYFSNGASSTAATGTDYLYISYSCDPLGRVLTTVNAVGTTTNAYDQWAVTVTDAENNTKTLYKDAYGNLVRVDEHNSAETYVTEYDYDLFGNLTQIEDALDNVRNFTYDGLGRLLKSEDLHAPADNQFASTTFAYDYAGNLTHKIDGKGQVTDYAYDDINRVLTEDFTGQGGTEVSYAYDSCAEGVGRLCVATTSAVVTEYGYNALGLVSSENRIIGGSSYETGYGYDRQGNQTMIVYPDGAEVKYDYNTAGLLEEVGEKESGAQSFSGVIMRYDYNPMGQIIEQGYASELETISTYDPSELYRLKNKSSGYFSEPVDLTIFAHYNDGYVRMTTTTADWDGAHDYPEGNYAKADSLIATTPYVSYSPAFNYYYLYRGYLPFYTAQIPDDANIMSATTSVYVISKYNSINDGLDFITIVKSYQGSTYATKYNYDDCGSDNGEAGRAMYVPVEGVDEADRKDITDDVSINQYLDFNLNDIGISWINKSGYTYLGLREGHDAMDVSIASSSDVSSGIYIKLSESSGTSTDPKLQITYNTDKIYQDYTYDYDKVGNISRIVDASDTNSRKVTEYTYDDLYRLTRASSTDAVNGQDYLRTYGYNALGNITNKSDIGNYSYTDSGYSNPHAATNINGATYAYDNNGNLISDGTWTHTWDYDNRLIGSTNGSTTISYGYDHTGVRVLMDNGTDTYHYPNRYYNISGATSTKHVFANNELVATIESNGATSTIYYIHTDHLGGSSVITDQGGEVVQLLDYYPYGGIRLNETPGNIDEKRKAFGHEYDDDSELYYMRARYQNPAVGRFLSIDPVFRDIGINDKIFRAKYNKDLYRFLKNPQSLNSYSYSYNNPILYVDPTGESGVMFPGLTYFSNKYSEIGRSVSNQIKGATEAVKAAAGIVVSATAIALAPEAAAPATIGAVTSLASRAYGDFQGDASFNEPASNYAKGMMIGGLGGQYFKDFGIIGIMVGAGITEGAEGMVVDGNVDPYGVAGASLGAGVSKGITGNIQVKSSEPILQQGFERLGQAVTEVVTSITSSEFVKNIFGSND